MKNKLTIIRNSDETKKRKKQNTKRALGIVFLLVVCFLVSFLIVEIDNDFKIGLEYARDYFVTTFILFGFSVASYVYLRSIKNTVNLDKVNNASVPTYVLYSVVFISLILYTVIAKYLNVYAIPFLLSSLLLLMLTDKSYANIGNLLTNILFIMIKLCSYLLAGTVSDTAAIFKYLIVVVLAMFGGMLSLSMVQTTKTRFNQLVSSILLGVLIFSINLLIQFGYLGFSKDLFINLWIFAGTVISIGVYYILLPVYEKVFNICTDSKLMDICKDNAPLLKELKEKAPGTYNHSLMVAHLSEVCATAIGENPLMARAAAYYHDVGKLYNPKYFTENLAGNEENPHDNLIPEVSAGIIIKHTTKGAEMIKEHNLPQSLQRVALEHHGNSVVMFFFNKAQSLSERAIDKNLYSYPNNKPSTKISAIIMICDTAEAATRANANKSYEEMCQMIKGLVNGKLNDGQFDNCDITMQDLYLITEAIINYVPGMYHKRPKYSDKN